MAVSDTASYISSESQICRTCLGSEGLAPIFTNAERHEKYSSALYLSTGLQIKMGDNLPHVICNDCIEAMKSALEFRDQSRRAERSLLRLQRKGKTLADIKKRKRHNNKAKKDSDYSTDKVDSDLDNAPIKFEDLYDKIDLNDGNDVDDKASDDDGEAVKENKDDDLFDTAELKVEIEIGDNNVLDDHFDGGDYEHTEPSKKRDRNGTADWYKRFKHLMDGPLDESGFYRCKSCNKMLKNFACFKSHAKRHFGFEFLCEQCGKTFVNGGMLRRHCMTQHGAERTSRCPHCDYGAIDNVQLKVHIRREHTGDRPFICDTCGASFRSRPHLIHHLAVHQTNRPVQCPHCPATFKSRQHLATHTSKVHRGRGWRAACYVCGKTYSKQMLVRRHIARHHAVPIHQQRPIQKVYEAVS